MKEKTTRRALLMSALSLLLCVSMLVGTTFAWFTDSVTSGRNTIQAGNLDVVLEYWDGDSYEEVTSTTKLFNDAALWEPGYTEVAYLKVSNAGSLALKYQLAVNVYNETLGKTKDGASITLSDHLQFKVVESDTDLADTYTRETAKNANATATKLQTYNSAVKPLDAKNEAGDNNYYDYVALIIYMPETVGNEANHDGVNVPSIEMGVNLLATQQTAESDSFDNQYDEDAEFDKSVKVTSEAELLAEISNASEDAANPTVISIANNFEISDTLQIPAGKYVKINGNGNTISRAADSTNFASAGAVGQNAMCYIRGNASITNLTVDANGDDTHRLRGFVVLGNADFTNCTITGTCAPDNWGGALLAGGGTINVDNCTISGNTAKLGAAASAQDGGTVNIKNTTISGNEGTAMGGKSLYGDANGAINISNSTITGDSALYQVGGNIYTISGDVAIDDIYNACNNATHRDTSTGVITYEALPAIRLTSTLEKDLVFYVSETGATIIRRTLLEGANGYNLTDADLAHVKVYFKDNVTTEYTLYDVSNATYELVVQDNRIEFVQK